MKNALCILMILIRFSVAQIEETTDPMPIEDACVENVILMVDSSTQITVRWDVSDDNCPADEYQVTYEATNLRQCGTSGGSSTTDWIEADPVANMVSLTDLVPYTSYQITVTPRSGENTLGTPIQAEETTSPEAPGTVTGLSITSSSSEPTQLQVSWTYNPSQCDLFVVEYILTNRDQCPELPTGSPVVHSDVQSSTSVTLTGLYPQSTYRVYVKAMNDEGTGTETSATGTTADSVPLEAPANVQVNTASTTDTSLTFTWEEVPCGSRQGAITGYRYEIGLPDQDLTTVDTGSTDLSVTVTGLDCNIQYNFRVAALTGVGAGPYSQFIAPTTGYSQESFATDQASVNPVTSTTVQVNWQTTACTSPQTQFTVQYQITNRDQCEQVNGDVETLPSVTGQESATISGLEPYSTYTVSVTGLAPSGESSDINGMFTTAEAAPNVSPVGVTIDDATTTTVTFSWNPIECGDRRGDLSYRYEVKLNGLYITGGDTTSTSATVAGLTGGNAYVVTVAGVTSAGETGPSSTGYTVNTPSPDPDEEPEIIDPEGEVCTTCTTNRVVGVVVVLESTAEGEEAVFTPELNDPTTPEYQELVVKVTITFQVFCDNLIGCIGVLVLGFFEGSIGVDMQYVFEDDSPTTGAMVVEEILDMASSNNNGVGGGLLIAPEATQVEDLCPPNYCSNGGTCISDQEQSSGFCSCAEGFGGMKCEDVVATARNTPKPADDLDNVAIAITVAVVGLLLIVALVALGFVIYVRIVRPKDALRRLRFTGRAHPPELLGQDPLLVDPVTLTSPWTYRTTLPDGEVFLAPRA